MRLGLAFLSPDELKCLVGVKENIPIFLHAIKLNQRKYARYNSLLGNMTPKSPLVQRHLPGIAVSLYEKNDQNFVKAMEAVAERAATMLLDYVGETLQKEITADELNKYSNEQVADIIKEFRQKENNVLEYEFLWVQLKLIGFPDVDERKNDILSLCGETIPEESTEEMPEEAEEAEEEMQEEAQEEQKKAVVKKAKAKKLTPKEKAEKTKLANAAKAKAKAVEKTEEAEIAEESQMVVSTEQFKEVPVKKEEIREEPEVTKHIGAVNFKKNHYNCTPIGYMDDNMFIPYTVRDLDERLLPESILHNINFFFKYLEESQVKFMRDKFFDGQLVWLNCELSELDANMAPTGERQKTGYKIDAEDGYAKGKIGPLSKIGLYKLLPLDALKDDYEKKRAVYIEPDDVTEGEEVLVNLENGFYAGPFEVKRASRDNGLFIIMQPYEGKFFTYGYRSEDCERVYIEPSMEVAKWIERDSWMYYTVKKGAKQISKDFISEKELLEAFKESLEDEKGVDVSKFDVEGIIERHGTSKIVGASIPPEIKDERIKKLKEMISGDAQLRQLNEETADLVLKVLLNNPENEETSQFFQNMIAANPDLLDQMQGVRAVQERIESVKAELEELNSQRLEMEDELNGIKKDSASENYELILSERLQEKEDEYNELCERVELGKDIDALNTTIEKLQEEAKNLDNHRIYLANEAKTIEKKFVEMINSNSAKIADVSFDGFVSDMMLKAAAEWGAKNEGRELSDKVKVLNAVATEPMKAEELVNYLVDQIQHMRPGYNRNVVINIITCISQGFLTVFSGRPGCGKTSICNIVAEVLGLNDYKNVVPELDDVSRYVPVSVERGWTSKRDFIGYYNPLTKTFEESEKLVFDGLKFLDEEKKKGYAKWPFLILLDEANLSPMEYYWADFMNVCDDLGEKSSINMGNDNIFHIPETLHFVATINNDHTTETLSPRLIDRAWIVTLPENPEIQHGRVLSKESIRNVTWNEIKAVFTSTGYSMKAFDRETLAVYDGLKDKLASQEMYISPRSEFAIQNYWHVASKLMEEDEFGNSGNIVALDFAIAQKVLPKISGSGQEYEDWLVDLKDYCDSQGLTSSAVLLGSIINRGRKKMKYYKFFD